MKRNSWTCGPKNKAYKPVASIHVVIDEQLRAEARRRVQAASPPPSSPYEMKIIFAPATFKNLEARARAQECDAERVVREAVHYALTKWEGRGR